MTLLHVQDAACGLDGWLAVASRRGRLAFGGLRVDAAVTARVVAALARGMDAKLLAHDIPIAGAKAGLRARPDDPRLPRMLSAFAAQAGHLLRTRVVLGKDMGAADWMLDALYASLQLPQLHLVPGAPPRIRDLGGYVPHMTGRGVAWAAEAAWDASWPAAPRVRVQGLGRVGAGAALRLAELGCRVVGASDAQGSVACEAGLALDVLLGALDGHGLLRRSLLPVDWRQAPRDALLGEPCHILVLAAASNAVGARLARRIEPSTLVIEGANLALTAAARSVLWERGVVVVPDVVASSSSAALVGHHLATAGRLDADTLWALIRAAIQHNTRAALDAARLCAMEPRRAFLAELRGR